MSYEKVKSICIETDKVFITSASNNVRPLTYDRQEYPYFTKILKEEGKDAVEIAILRNYEEGNLQGGSNKYTKALRVLRYVFKEEYKKFNWNNFSYEERDKERELRNSQEFKNLLLKALNYKIPKVKYIISKPNGENNIYGRRTKWTMSWKYSPEEATKYDFKEEAEQDKSCFKYNNDWDWNDVFYSAIGSGIGSLIILFL
jgi:hypothetical protein